MGRQPTEPRWREDRGIWYVQIDGKQRTLAKGVGNKKAAWAELRRLMAERDRPATIEEESPPVWKVVKLYVDHLTNRRDAGGFKKGSKKDAERRLAEFVPKCGRLKVDEIRPHHVLAWVEARRWVPPHKKGSTPPEPRPLGPTARHDCIAAAKAIFRWAKKVGHIDRDPLDGVDKPKRNKRRELVIGKEQWPIVRAAILSERFRDLCDFLYETGARPGEAFRLEGRHVDIARKVVLLSPKEHKTGEKTSKYRAVFLSAYALAIVARLKAKHPDGSLFLNQCGQPWNKNSVNCQVCRIRARLKGQVGREFVAYALRHLFATDAIDKKVPIATVAGMLGHADTRMVAEVYARLDERPEHFIEALEMFRPAEEEGKGGH